VGSLEPSACGSRDRAFVDRAVPRLTLFAMAKHRTVSAPLSRCQNSTQRIWIASSDRTMGHQTRRH
jgi:hypothetical protein